MNDNYDYIKLIEKIRTEKDMDELANLYDSPNNKYLDRKIIGHKRDM
ncbi:hypothetical protein [Enterococcus faecium]|nr:hypothetical protein [Enterococcus faecium]OTN91133.1 hypothetical protein A5809_000497 [Enterococcus faecium]